MSGTSEYWLTKTGDIAPANAANTALGLQVASLETRFDNNYLTIGSAQSTAGALTTGQLINNILPSAPTAAIVLTTPTAAAIVAADGNASVGRGFKFTIVNTSVTTGATVTLGAGTGVSILGSAVVAITASASFYASYTNVTTGTCALTIVRTTA
jgi:hypothetical protein